MGSPVFHLLRLKQLEQYLIILFLCHPTSQLSTNLIVVGFLFNLYPISYHFSAPSLLPASAKLPATWSLWVLRSSGCLAASALGPPWSFLHTMTRQALCWESSSSCCLILMESQLPHLARQAPHVPSLSSSSLFSIFLFQAPASVSLASLVSLEQSSHVPCSVFSFWLLSVPAALFTWRSLKIAPWPTSSLFNSYLVRRYSWSND